MNKKSPMYSGKSLPFSSSIYRAKKRHIYSPKQKDLTCKSKLERAMRTLKRALCILKRALYTRQRAIYTGKRALYHMQIEVRKSHTYPQKSSMYTEI